MSSLLLKFTIIVTGCLGYQSLINAAALGRSEMERMRQARLAKLEAAAKGKANVAATKEDQGKAMAAAPKVAEHNQSAGGLISMADMEKLVQQAGANGAKEGLVKLKLLECSVCQEPNPTIVTVPCDGKTLHAMCRDCFTTGLEKGSMSNEDNPKKICCPICRAPYSRANIEAINKIIGGDIREIYKSLRNLRLAQDEKTQLANEQAEADQADADEGEDEDGEEGEGDEDEDEGDGEGEDEDGDEDEGQVAMIAQLLEQKADPKDLARLQQELLEQDAVAQAGDEDEGEAENS